jgi:hypothetical protein
MIERQPRVSNTEQKGVAEKRRDERITVRLQPRTALSYYYSIDG